ncbi:MAG: CU044_2847 family protein [Methylococcales bacterium]|nr:CU044_2847 family protein [Methylococcales bacterium]
MTNMIEFKLDNGESAFMQLEESEVQTQTPKQVSRGGSRRGPEESDIITAPRSFDDAIKSIAPIGKSLISSLKDINTPDEISLEFAISFNGKAGVVFSSVESKASFKVNIKWKNPT